MVYVCLQMTGKDKDYRYMATSDLLNELNKDSFKADTDLEIKLSNIIIQQLDDVAGDVSGLAVKWYGNSHYYFNGDLFMPIVGRAMFTLIASYFICHHYVSEPVCVSWIDSNFTTCLC